MAPWTLILFAVVTVASAEASAQQACRFGYPVGDERTGAPLSNNHPVNGTNLPDFGRHLGGDYWSGGGCTDEGQPVYAVADGEIVEIVDALGSYLDVVVVRHDVPDVGNVYSMYGHIRRDDGLAEGQMVSRRQQIGAIDNVLAYFSPCHLHFELLNQAAFVGGPFCNGCAAAGFKVSPGYDRNTGVETGNHPVTGDPYLNVLNDGVDGNWWYFTDEFIDARLDAECGAPDFEILSEDVPTRLYRDAPRAAVALRLRNSGMLTWDGGRVELVATDANELLIGADCSDPAHCSYTVPGTVAPEDTVDIAFDVAVADLTAMAGTSLSFEWTLSRDGQTFGSIHTLGLELCEQAGTAECLPMMGGESPARPTATNNAAGGETPPATSGEVAKDGAEEPGGNVVRAEGSACSSTGHRAVDAWPLVLVLALGWRRRR